MARTWSLYATLSVASSSDFLPWSRALVNGAGTEVYFVRNAADQKVYAWDGGASLDDLTGTGFPTGFPDLSAIFDICVFDGELFLAYGTSPVVGSTSIYRWQGGTSWDNEYSLRNEADTLDGWIAQGIGGVDSYPWPMDCDANYMAIAGTISSTNTETFRRMWVRDTAGNYSVTQMPGPSYPAPGYQLVGKSKGSDYSGLVGFNRLSATNYQPVLIGGPSPWTNLTGAGIGSRIPIGYGEGLSFFSENTPTGTATWELKYSNDWGETLFTAGGLTFDENHERAEWKFKNIGNGVIMLATETHQVYTWDADTATFIEDGTTSDIDGNRTIHDFFRLNGQLFALTNSVTANSVEMWVASEPTCQASLYYGIEVPQFSSDLPFCVTPGGLAISAETHLAVLGTAGPAGQSVIFGQAPYTTFADISGIVPTGTAVNSIKFI